jgi:hypothetical protein
MKKHVPHNGNRHHARNVRKEKYRSENRDAFEFLEYEYCKGQRNHNG